MASLQSILPTVNSKSGIGSLVVKAKDGTSPKLLDFFDDNLFSKILPAYISKSYLSHWKSSIEEIVLQNRKAIFQKQVAFKVIDGVDVDFQRAFYTRMANTLYKIVIIFKPTKTPGITVSDAFDFIDIIAINNTLTTVEQRVVVAHELGHVIINRLLKENSQFAVVLTTEQKEDIANLFMYYILQDKSEFYKETAQSYIKTPGAYKEIYQKIIDTFGNIQHS